MFDPSEIYNIYNGRPIPFELCDMLENYDIFNLQEKLKLVPRKTPKKSAEFRRKGNDLYRKKRHSGTASHTMILSLYTQSIAYAPSGSEELALALSNRSALLLHLNKYDLCLIDIERALNITTSNDLKHKLLTRQTECFRLTNSMPQTQKKQIKLPNITHSSFIPCAADCIKLDCNEKRGRHYTATRDIEPGKIIISEKTPFKFVRPEHIYLTCSQCLAFAWVGIPCDSCVYAIYCSENCKNEAWSQYHDIECTITPFLDCEGMLHEGLLRVNLIDLNIVLKTLIILVRKDGLKHILEEAMGIPAYSKGTSVGDLLSNNGLNCQKFRFIYNLATVIEREKYIDERLSVVLSLALTFLLEEYKLSQCQTDFGTAMATMKIVLKRLFNICNCNFYGFEASLCTCADNTKPCPPECASQRGFILAPCSSLINHSCDPNVERLCIPEHGIVIYTLRPIKKGEQICISYGPESYTTSRGDRLANLLEVRGFICTCKACDQDWPDATACLEMTTESLLRKLMAHFPQILAEKYLTMVTPEPGAKPEFSDESLRDAMAMQNIMYKNFDDLSAYILSGPLKYHIRKWFRHFYGEIMDLNDTC